MNIVIRILTIYIFALSLAPCGDGGGGIVVIANQLLGWETNIEGKQNSDPCENSPCSPFCICSSCFMALDTAKEIYLPERILSSVPETPPLFTPQFHSSSFNHSIWQPPQLG